MIRSHEIGKDYFDFMAFCTRKEIERLDPLARRAGLRRDDDGMERNPFIRGLMVRYRFREMPVDFLVPRDGRARRRVVNSPPRCAIIPPS